MFEDKSRDIESIRKRGCDRAKRYDEYFANGFFYVKGHILLASAMMQRRDSFTCLMIKIYLCRAVTTAC